MPDQLAAVGAKRFVFVADGVFLTEQGWALLPRALETDAPLFFADAADTLGARCFAWSVAAFTVTTDFPRTGLWLCLEPPGRAGRWCAAACRRRSTGRSGARREPGPHRHRCPHPPLHQQRRGGANQLSWCSAGNVRCSRDACIERCAASGSLQPRSYLHPISAQWLSIVPGGNEATLLPRGTMGNF